METPAATASSVAPIPVAPLALAVSGEPDPVLDATFHDLATMVLQKRSRAGMASALMVSQRQLLRYLQDPRFHEIYEARAARIYGNTDELIKDEKADDSLRKMALRARATTMIGEVLEEVHAHMDNNIKQSGSRGNTRASMIRAAVEAYRAVSNIDDQGRQASGTTVQVMNVTPDAARQLRDIANESAIDVSDVLEEMMQEKDTKIPYKENA